MNLNRKRIVLIITVIFTGLLLGTNYYASGEEQGPLGAFGIFAFNSYNQSDSNVEGRIYGKRVILDTGQVASGYDSQNVMGYYLNSLEYPSVVAVSEYQNTNTTVNGEVLTKEDQELDNQSYLLKIESLITTLTTIETGEETNVQINESNGIASKNTSNLIVSELDNPAQSVISEITLKNLSSSQNLIIKVPGKTVEFTDVLITLDNKLVELGVKDTTDTNVEMLANNIVWVMEDASQINIKDSQFVGTIIAPKATVTIDNSYVYGQVISNNVNILNQSLIANFVCFAHEYQFTNTDDTVDTTIEFVDEDGNKIADDEVLTAPANSEVSYIAKEINNYVAVDSEQVAELASGFKTQTKNQSIQIVYELQTSAVITVYHQLTDGTNIVSPIEIEGEIDSEYTTNALTDSNYTLVETPANSSGIVTGDISVIYVYALAGSTYTITINHYDQSGSKISPTNYVVLEHDSAYDVSSYVASNNVYDYVGLSDNSSPISGTLTENISINFEYQLISTCPQLSETLVSGANSGQSYSLSGYKRVTANEIEFNEATNYLVEKQSTTIAQSGINFGNGYTSEAQTNFVDYKYAVDSSSSYSQFFPISQSGTFSPINFVITNDGSSYDLRSRTSTATIGTYANNQIGYQKLLANNSTGSLLVRLEECQMVVSYTSSSGAITEIGAYSYTNFPNLGKEKSGVAFDYNATSKQLSISIINQSSSKLEYSGNTVVVDLSGYSFAPNDYNLIYSDSAESTTAVYSPYVNVDRHMVEMIGINTPYIDTTSTKVSASTIIGRNKLYLVYSKNGTITYRKNYTATSVIKKTSFAYNPQSYKTITTSSTMGTGIYGYIAGASYTVPNTNLTLSSEMGLVYGKQTHPSYTMSISATSVSMQQSQYKSILENPNYSPSITVTKAGEVVANSYVKTDARNYIIDDSSIDYNTVGNYTAIGYVRSRDNVTGMPIIGEVAISLTVASATNDYGDAPSTYGDGGVKNGTSSYRYTIGINRNGNRSSHADAEGSPQYSDDALGDDTLGMSDEDGWFNMDPSGSGELNIQMDSIQLSFPYTATGTATVGVWFDFNQNGVYEANEGYVKNVSSSSYDKYGMVSFNVNLKPDGSTLESGDDTFVRVRIVRGSNAFTTADAAKTISNYGETEDYKVHFYGKETPAQICTSSLANTPIITIKTVTSVSNAGPNSDETGIKYVVDIGDSSLASIAPNSYYKNVTITVSSKQGIVSNTSSGEPTFFRVEKSVSPYESPANTIHISVRDQSGNPLNLPLTFTFWDLDDFTSSNVVESVSISKDKMFLEGLLASNIGLTYDTVGVVEDFSSYLKLFTTKQVESEPSAAFYINGDSLALADIEIVEEARLLEIGMGLDLNEMTMLINECVEPYEPKAQIQIFDQFYDDEVNVYNSYPFAYQSTNIPFPYFSDFNNVTQNLTIPTGVEFVDGDDSVKIYRRSFLGDRSEDEWELVDSKYYTQTIVGNTSSVTFNNPIANKLYGYEYRMEYNFEISESMKTGQKVVFQSNVVYNKGTSGQYKETYQLNSVTAYVRDAFTMDIDTITNDETIYVENSSKVLSYTYEYANCESCVGVDELTPFTAEINIPIVDDELLTFANNSEYARYEEIILSIYDNEMKVFEVPIRRWKQAQNEQVVISGDSEIYDQLNPVSQTIQIRAAYKKWGLEQPVNIYYSAEKIQLSTAGEVNTAIDGIFDLSNIDVTIDTTPQSQVPSSWDSNTLEITADQLIGVNQQLLTNYSTDNESVIYANIDGKMLDETLETSTSVIKGQTYSDIYYQANLTSDGSKLTWAPTLDDKYIIEQYSGRIYNTATNEECKYQFELVDGSELNKECNNLLSLDNFGNTTSQVASGYNDSLDKDIVINSVNSQLPLNVDEAQEKSNYYLSLVNFGFSNTSLIYQHQLAMDGKQLSYYQDDGKYYFQRQNPSETAVECIKANSCSGEFVTITSGKVEDLAKTRADITEKTDISTTYKSVIDQMISEW